MPPHALRIFYTDSVEAQRCEGFGTCLRMLHSVPLDLGIVRVEP